MSVKDKKSNGQPQEVEKMLDRMVSNRPAKIEEQPDLNKNWCFHNTKKLLQRYRSTLMCIAVARTIWMRSAWGLSASTSRRWENLPSRWMLIFQTPTSRAGSAPCSATSSCCNTSTRPSRVCGPMRKTARSSIGSCISNTSAPTRTSARRMERWWRNCGKRACRCPAAPSTAAATWP